MNRLLPLFAVAILLPIGLVGCGSPPEPPKVSDAELEEHRQEMIDVSNRERGG
jgi:hypothetical protein